MFIRWITLLKISNPKINRFWCHMCENNKSVVTRTCPRNPANHRATVICQYTGYIVCRSFRTNKRPCHVAIDIKDLRVTHWGLPLSQILIRRLRLSSFRWFAENRYRTASRRLTNNIASKRCGAWEQLITRFALKIPHSFKVQSSVQFRARPSEHYSLRSASCHETHKCSTALCADISVKFVQIGQ